MTVPPVIPQISITTVMAIMNGISYLRVDFCTVTLVISAVTPRIINTFIMLLPTTFPMVMPAFCFSAAVMLTAASGMLVPMATMVRPMIS